MGLSYFEASSEQAFTMDALAGSSDQAYFSTVSWLLMWAAAIRSHAEIIGNKVYNN